MRTIKLVVLAAICAQIIGCSGDNKGVNGGVTTHTLTPNVNPATGGIVSPTGTTTH